MEILQRTRKGTPRKPLVQGFAIRINWNKNGALVRFAAELGFQPKDKVQIAFFSPSDVENPGPAAFYIYALPEGKSGGFTVSQKLEMKESYGAISKYMQMYGLGEKGKRAFSTSASPFRININGLEVDAFGVFVKNMNKEVLEVEETKSNENTDSVETDSDYALSSDSFNRNTTSIFF
jgi:hypothetical protein